MTSATGDSPSTKAVLGNPKLSFEFFPAKTAEQERRFWRTIGCLETLRPEFFSMTYGALGAARTTGFDMLQKLTSESEIPVAAHLTCAGRNKSELAKEVREFADLGIKHFIALRGDAVSESDSSADTDVCHYAEDLVDLLDDLGDYEVSVAAYPEVHPDAVSATADMDALKRKLDKGADRAITQFFYNSDAFLQFRDKAVAAGITQKIVPGILPVHDIERVINFSQRCGTAVPDNLVDEFRVWSHDAEASRELAIAHGISLCEILKKEGVDHFHFYTLNQSDLSFEVSRLLVSESASETVAA